MNYYNYFTEIEETFIRRRGKNLLLSPLDWALIENWEQREIPLHIILRAIETVFDGVDKQPSRKRTVKGLFYCKEEIEAQYAEWLEMQTGARSSENAQHEISNQSNHQSELFAPDTIKNHLENVTNDLEKAAQNAGGELFETLERVLNRLEKLKKDVANSEKLEQSLEKLDELLDEALLKLTAPEKLLALENEVEKNLESYKSKMEREVFQRTFELMLLKRLRETAEIPRLSLFYI